MVQEPQTQAREGRRLFDPCRFDIQFSELQIQASSVCFGDAIYEHVLHIRYELENSVLETSNVHRKSPRTIPDVPSPQPPSLGLGLGLFAGCEAAGPLRLPRRPGGCRRSAPPQPLGTGASGFWRGRRSCLRRQYHFLYYLELKPP